MSKHDTFKNNLFAITRSRSFDKATDGWIVIKLVTLPNRQQQACELCGTRFSEGALVRYSKSKARVLIGGICLRTLQERRFPKGFNWKKAKHFTNATLRKHYSPYRRLVDPGNWRLWIRDHAPKRLMQAVADLWTFGVVIDLEQLKTLIRFHDSRRLFPRNAFFKNPKMLEHTLGVKIAKYITINQAQELDAKGRVAIDVAKLQTAPLRYLRKHVLPRVNDDPDLAPLWRYLGPLEKRAVTALAALDEHATRHNGPLVPEQVAANWPQPSKAPMIVWNATIGLGFVGEDDVYESPKSYVWLWRSGRYRRATYNLNYWHGVVGCSPNSVRQLEKLAFGR